MSVGVQKRSDRLSATQTAAWPQGAGEVANDLLLPLPHEIQQQLKDVDEIEIERQRTPDR